MSVVACKGCGKPIETYLDRRPDFCRVCERKPRVPLKLTGLGPGRCVAGERPVTSSLGADEVMPKKCKCGYPDTETDPGVCCWRARVDEDAMALKTRSFALLADLLDAIRNGATNGDCAKLIEQALADLLQVDT